MIGREEGKEEGKEGGRRKERWKEGSGVKENFCSKMSKFE